MCMCYSLINPCGYWTSLKELYLPLLLTGIARYNVLGVKTHLSVNLPQSVGIRRA